QRAAAGTRRPAVRAAGRGAVAVARCVGRLPPARTPAEPALSRQRHRGRTPRPLLFRDPGPVPLPPPPRPPPALLGAAGSQGGPQLSFWGPTEGKGAGDPFQALQHSLRQWQTETLPGLPPFQGGAAGLFGYDLCHHIERLPRPDLDEFQTPDLAIGFYDWVIA